MVLKINFRKLIFVFIIANFFLILSSIFIFKNMPNPYREQGITPDKVYELELCDKIKNNFILTFSECPTKTDFQNMLSNHYILSLFGYSNYYKFYTYGSTIDHFKDNVKYYLHSNPIYYLKKDKLVNDYFVGNNLAAHSFLLGIFIHFGLLYGIIFLINLFYLVLKNKKFPLLMIFIIGSAFLSLDTMLFFPILLLNLIGDNKKL